MPETIHPILKKICYLKAICQAKYSQGAIDFKKALVKVHIIKLHNVNFPNKLTIDFLSEEK